MYQLITVDANTWPYESVMDDGDSVRFFVLDGAEKCLVIDSGFYETDVKTMVLEHLKKYGKDKTPSGAAKEILLANTHGDFDHTAGNGSFPFFYMTQKDYDQYGLLQRFPASGLLPASEGLILDLGGRRIRYILAPGHTHGNTVLLDETNRVLYPGDMVQTGTMFMFGPTRCPDELRGSLLKLKNLKDCYDKLYTCHGQLVLPVQAVDHVIAAWDKVLNHEETPVIREVLGVKVDLYDCGFCRFYCNHMDKSRI